MRGQKVLIRIRMTVKSKGGFASSTYAAPRATPVWSTPSATPVGGTSSTPAGSGRAYRSSLGRSLSPGAIWGVVLVCVVVVSLGFFAVWQNANQQQQASDRAAAATNAPIPCYNSGCNIQMMNSTIVQDGPYVDAVFTNQMINAELVYPLSVTQRGFVVVGYGCSYLSQPGNSESMGVGAGGILTAQLLDDHFRLIAPLTDPEVLDEFYYSGLAASGTYYLTIELIPSKLQYLNDPSTPEVGAQCSIQIIP